MKNLSLFQESCRQAAVYDLNVALGNIENLTSGDPVEDEWTSELIESARYDIMNAIKKLSQ